jgi:hypothetical protein
MPTSATLAGTWMSDSGNIFVCFTSNIFAFFFMIVFRFFTGVCGSFSTSGSNLVLVNSVALPASDSYTVSVGTVSGTPGPALWPPSTLYSNITSSNINADPAPVSSTCNMFIDMKTTSSSYVLNCNNANQWTYTGAFIFGLKGVTPSFSSNGGYGSSFYTQQFVKNTPSSTSYKSLSKLNSLYGAYPAAPLVYNDSTANLWAFAVNWNWAPNCNMCPPGQYQYTTTNTAAQTLVCKTCCSSLC